ncbi:MAG: hypothetical protein C4291_14835, partial [Candidatus Dadabacteria bacterium]
MILAGWRTGRVSVSTRADVSPRWPASTACHVVFILIEHVHGMYLSKECIDSTGAWTALYKRAGYQMVVLDIGCGRNKVPGSIGVDVARVGGVDVVGTVERLPFKENTADVVYLSHVLEHVDSLVDAMEEIWRVCKHGALVHIWGPHFSCGLYTWSDPTHRRAFTSTVFDYFDPSAPLSYYSRALPRAAAGAALRLPAQRHGGTRVPSGHDHA